MNWTAFISHFTEGHHIEGLFYVILGFIMILWLNIHFMEPWTNGFKGRDHKWEAPEIIIYIFVCWISPMVVIVTSFTDIRPPDAVWLYLGVNLMFALLGRWGLEWILAFKSGTNTVPPIENKPTPQ